MDGYTFRGKRESLEEMFVEINVLIDKKSKKDAQLKLKKATKALNKLSDEDLSEIQQRALQNRQYLLDNMVEKIKQLTN